MTEAELAKLLSKQVGKGDVSSVVAGVRSADGSVDIAAAAGTADPDGSTPMTVGTPYLLASISKMYTAATIMRLVEQARLNLDEPLSTHLPEEWIDRIHVYDGTDHSPDLTVRHLVDQTSGLADYYEGKTRAGTSLSDELKGSHDRPLSTADIMDIVRTLKPEFPPGASNGGRAHYSDTNYQLLGRIIESVTGTDLAASYQKLVFGPLGLTRTYPYASIGDRADLQPAAVFMNEQVVHLPQFLSSQTAEGGLVATLDDSLSFLQGFFEERLLARSTLDSMMKWNRVFFPVEYGSGLMRFDLPRALTLFRKTPELIGHSGSTGSFAFYCPSRALYVAGTINQLASPSRAFRLATQIVAATS